MNLLTKLRKKKSNKKLISLDSIEERKGADVEEKQTSMSFDGNETFRFGCGDIDGGITFLVKQRR